jgi:hypothetical protein
MLRLIQVHIFQFPADDLIDSREDDVVNRSKAFQRLDE